MLASGRTHSEDRAEIVERGDALVVVVADGAGGMRGGATASAALVETVRGVATSGAVDLHEPETWVGLLKETDAALFDRRAGETTGVIVVIDPGGIVGASVGDSEAWIVTGKATDDLTRGQESPRLGSGRAAPVTFQRGRLDGTLLVATDGLFKSASPARVVATVRGGDVSAVGERLTGLIRLPSGGFQDDVAIVIVAPPGQR